MQIKILKEKIRHITTWKRGSQRAPHKPLLILYALGRLLNNDRQFVEYTDVDRDLKELLIEFGPLRKSYHPEYPFWRLQNDDIWILQNAEKTKTRRSNTDALKSDLLKFNVKGGFPDKIYQMLKNNHKLVFEIVRQLLDDNFPESIHSDILRAVGIDEESFGKGHIAKRNPEFRERILKAYEYKCAVCGFDIRLRNRTIGLEAAHIKWHQAGGPDTEENGIALCVMHHKLFDFGAFSLIPAETSFEFHASDSVHGTKGFDEWLMAFHKKPIIPPQHPKYAPDKEYVKWHVREVFKGYGRY